MEFLPCRLYCYRIGPGKRRGGGELRHSVLSPQPGVFGFGLLKNRDVGVGVLPERQEILVGSLRLGVVAKQSESSAQLQMGQSAHRIGANNAAVIENLLKFSRGFNPPMSGQIRLTAHIGWVKASEVGCERGPRYCKIVSEGGLQEFDCLRRLVASECEKGAERW